MIINALTLCSRLLFNANNINIYPFQRNIISALAIPLCQIRPTLLIVLPTIPTPTLQFFNLPFISLYRITLKISDDPP